MTTESRPWYQTCWITLPSLAMTLITRLVVRKDSANQIFLSGQVVAGIEGDVDWSGINGTTNNSCPLGCKTSNTWLATVRGRLGYAADRFMPQTGESVSAAFEATQY